MFRFVSDKELNRIERGKISVASRDSNTSKNHQRAKIPYKAIFTDKVVWGIVIGVIGIQLGYFLFVQFGPVYMNKVAFKIFCYDYAFLGPQIRHQKYRVWYSSATSDFCNCENYCWTFK